MKSRGLSLNYAMQIRKMHLKKCAVGCSMSSFFDGKALLHSEPNNPGVEVVPVYHSASEKRISFQAKYFSAMDYEQIKHSARTAVSHYAGQLDVIYLYCNKDVTTSSQGYKAIESILDPHGI